MGALPWSCFQAVGLKQGGPEALGPEAPLLEEGGHSTAPSPGTPQGHTGLGTDAPQRVAG